MSHKMTYIVNDAMGKMKDREYCTQYHAEQMARALNLNDATKYNMYYGSHRFTVKAL